MSDRGLRAFTLSTILLLSALTLHRQEQRIGLEYIYTESLHRHQQIMEGTAPRPFRFRILSEVLLHPIAEATKAMNAPRAVAIGFLSFRLLQNLILFSLAALYYRRIGLNGPAVVVGLSMMGWMIMTSYYQGGLSFNTYTEVIFYLLAAMAIQSRREFWVLPITILACANRETSGLIPVMLGVHAWIARAEQPERVRPNLILAAQSLVAFGIVFVGLRILIGQAPTPAWSFWESEPPGLRMLWWNLKQLRAWDMVLATTGVLPLLVALRAKQLPVMLRAYLLAILPIYYTVHYMVAYIWETRYFITPMTLVVIPAALWLVARAEPRSGDAAAPARA